MEASRPSTHKVKSPSQYRHETREFPVFSTKVERTLCYHWHDHHSIFAAHRLAGNYLYLVRKIVEGYGSYGVPVQELMGEGYVGLVRAVCRFDPDRGVAFTPYATWRVREAIHEYMLRTKGMSLLHLVSFCAVRGERGHLQVIGDPRLDSAY